MPLSEASQRDGQSTRARTQRLLRLAEVTPDDATCARLRAEVVVLNMGVARSIASRYRGRGIEYSDLVQASYVGLIKAVQGFDASLGSDFLSYAVPTVSGEVKRYFRDHAWAIRPPRRVQELHADVVVATGELSQRLGRSARPSEIADHLELPVSDIVEAIDAVGSFNTVSLDVPTWDTGAATLAERLGYDDPGLSRAEDRVWLGPALATLSERDRLIVELRFNRGLTQDQIAAEIGVTQMQVSRLLTRILKDLRQSVPSDQVVS